jgi:hypothetical protein
MSDEPTNAQRARKIRRVIEQLDLVAHDFEVDRPTVLTEERLNEAVVELCKVEFPA